MKLVKAWVIGFVRRRQRLAQEIVDVERDTWFKPGVPA
ncbi:HMA domain-containing protein [Psidium guajava]|nr:HMA domain-containing protein [Psidium guajava]